MSKPYTAREFILDGIITLAVLKATSTCITKFWNRLVKKNTVLELDLDGDFTEHVGIEKPWFMKEKKQVLFEILETLDRAAKEKNVVGIVLKIGNPKLGIAQVSELFHAVENCRDNGKICVAYADSFGELSSCFHLYYLASACNHVFMSPSGMLGLNGMMMVQMFFKGTMEKLDVKPFIAKRKNYKTAANMYMAESMDEYHREMITELMTTIWAKISNSVKYSRGFTDEKFGSLMDQGPYSSEEALELGLIDGIAYSSQVYESLSDIILKRVMPDFSKPKEPLSFWNKLFQSKVNLMYSAVFSSQVGMQSSLTKGPKVAVVTLTGMIHQGKSELDLYGLPTSIGSTTVCAILASLAKDSSIAAVLLRVDSGGGSYTASDHIYRAILDLKRAGKKIVVSMANVAASGGYFLAMAADTVVANSLTMTGSIGVLAGKMNMRGLYQKIGISFDDARTSDQASLFSNLHSYSDSQSKFLDKMLDYIYEDFTKKVSISRGRTRDDVETAAQGRVWMGESAKTLGLVDEIGGYFTALESVRKVLKLEKSANISLSFYPRVLTFWDRLVAKKSQNSQDIDVFSSCSPLVSRFQSLVGTVAPLANLFSNGSIVRSITSAAMSSQSMDQMIQAEISDEVSLAYASVTGYYGCL